jgi:hypothetical protein
MPSATCGHDLNQPAPLSHPIHARRREAALSEEAARRELLELEKTLETRVVQLAEAQEATARDLKAVQECVRQLQAAQAAAAAEAAAAEAAKPSPPPLPRASVRATALSDRLSQTLELALSASSVAVSAEPSAAAVAAGAAASGPGSPVAPAAAGANLMIPRDNALYDDEVGEMGAHDGTAAAAQQLLGDLDDVAGRPLRGLDRSTRDVATEVSAPFSRVSGGVKEEEQGGAYAAPAPAEEAGGEAELRLQPAADDAAGESDKPRRGGVKGVKGLDKRGRGEAGVKGQAVKGAEARQPTCGACLVQ